MSKKKKILIIGWAHSTHTHAWIKMLPKDKFDVRLFGIENTSPGDKAGCEYYCFDENYPAVADTGQAWIDSALVKKLRNLIKNRVNYLALERNWLKKIIKSWRPDVIHTLGINPAGLYFLPLRDKMPVTYKWVVTLRGGSDLELERFNPEKRQIFEKIFHECDKVLADNLKTYEYAEALGLKREKRPDFPFIPGAGGVDTNKLSKMRKGATTKSRLILWPKAYDAIYSKGLPVLEAIKIAWPKIYPCQIIMTAVYPEFRQWLPTLPPDIYKSIKIYPRIKQNDLLKMMARSRVVLLPSLIDGIPNALYEAMATKTIPIVSPLPTIKTEITEDNVIFARNLYPQEIADALVMGMNDNVLAEKIIRHNLTLVSQIANRRENKKKLQKFYEDLN